MSPHHEQPPQGGVTNGNFADEVECWLGRGEFARYTGVARSRFHSHSASRLSALVRWRR